LVFRKRIFRKHYTYRFALDKIVNLLERDARLSYIYRETRATVAVIATKTLLANSDLFEKDFRFVSKKANELFMKATHLERTVTSYQIPIDSQEDVIKDIFIYVRDQVKTRIEEPFGEKVRWPWNTMNEGGDCDCKSVLLASMLAYLGFDVRILVIPPNLHMGHSFISVYLKGPTRGTETWWNLDPSDYRSSINAISPDYERYKKNAYIIDLIQFAEEIELQKI
jgi:hypothetical protein